MPTNRVARLLATGEDLPMVQPIKTVPSNRPTENQWKLIQQAENVSNDYIVANKIDGFSSFNQKLEMVKKVMEADAEAAAHFFAEVYDLMRSQHAKLSNPIIARMFGSH